LRVLKLKNGANTSSWPRSAAKLPCNIPSTSSPPEVIYHDDVFWKVQTARASIDRVLAIYSRERHIRPASRLLGAFASEIKKKSRRVAIRADPQITETTNNVSIEKYRHSEERF